MNTSAGLWGPSCVRESARTTCAPTKLLKQAYTAIKAADPNITVVGGVLGAGATIGTLTVNPVTFLQQMYADGAAGSFDALSFHPYNYTSTFSQGKLFPNSAIDQLNQMRTLMNANGDASKLIWTTEYGEPSTEAGGEAQQAAYVQDFLSTWSTLKGVGPMFLYSLLDDDENDNLGLFKDDWTPKAAVAVVTAWLAAHPTADPPAIATAATTAAADAAAVAADPPADPPANPIVSMVASAAQMIATDLSKMMAGAAGAVRQMLSGITTALANMVANLKPRVSTMAAPAVNAKSVTSTTMAPSVSSALDSATNIDGPPQTTAQPTSTNAKALAVHSVSSTKDPASVPAAATARRAAPSPSNRTDTVDSPSDSTGATTGKNDSGSAATAATANGTGTKSVSTAQDVTKKSDGTKKSPNANQSAPQAQKQQSHNNTSAHSDHHGH